MAMGNERRIQMHKSLIIGFVFLIAFTGMAHGLSNTPPSTLPFNDDLIIEDVNITGVAPVTAGKLRNALLQKTGERVSITGVKCDLRAIAKWFRENKTADVEGWSGLELITSRITVTLDIEELSGGQAMLTYKVKDWFPEKN
jgi:hypothetical protein